MFQYDVAPYTCTCSLIMHILKSPMPSSCNNESYRIRGKAYFERAHKYTCSVVSVVFFHEESYTSLFLMYEK